MYYSCLCMSFKVNIRFYLKKDLRQNCADLCILSQWIGQKLRSTAFPMVAETNLLQSSWNHLIYGTQFSVQEECCSFCTNDHPSQSPLMDSKVADTFEQFGSWPVPANTASRKQFWGFIYTFLRLQFICPFSNTFFLDWQLVSTAPMQSGCLSLSGDKERVAAWPESVCWKTTLSLSLSFLSPPLHACCHNPI